MPKSIAYIGGVGRLGLSLAVWSAEVGFQVTIADVNEAAVKMINNGECPISEPFVAAYIKKHIGINLFARTSTRNAVLASELIFVIVPTPSNENGSFSLKYVLAACEDIGKGLKLEGKYKVVVIVSTVNPGDTRGPIRRALERNSGKQAGDHFGLVYSPEFVRQGSIIHDFAHPDKVLTGEFDGGSIASVVCYYARIVQNEAPFHIMSLESAEIAKLGLNAALATKIAVGNSLTWLAHYTPNADAKDVLRAVGADPRIGSRFFKPGLYAGGPCLPRDNRALVKAMKKARLITYDVAEGVVRSVESEIFELCSMINGYRGEIAILGLTFKPGTDIVDDSPGPEIAKALSWNWKRTVYAYDPVAPITVGITRVRSLKDCVEMSDVLVITTPWEEFKALEKMDLVGKKIIDCWGILREGDLNCDRYIRLGKGPSG